MKRLTAWSSALFGLCDRYRHPLLLVTVLLACFFYYVIFKWMEGGSLHALAHAYAQAVPDAVALVRSGASLHAATWVQALELGIDTLLIPAYAALLLLYANLYPPDTQHTHWSVRLLNKLSPWLPALILIGACADLLENSCLAIWAFSQTMLLTPAALLLVRYAKFIPFFGAVGYVLLRFLLSKPALRFMVELSNYLWYVFKAFTLNKYIRCGVAMLRTVWPVCIVLFITYLFLNVMDQARDLLYSLVNDVMYSIGLFTCLLLYALAIWYSTRILFMLKDQRHLVERVSPNDRDKLALTQYLINRKDPDWRLTKLPAHRIIDSRTLRAFTRWTPVVLGLVPFFACIAALGKIEDTTPHQLTLVLEMLVYVGIVYQVNNYVVNKPQPNKAVQQADDSNIDPHRVRDLELSHKRTLRTAFGSSLLLIVVASYGPSNLFISKLLGPVAIVFLALTMWALIASFFTYLDYRYKAPFTLICLLIMMFMNNNNHQIRTISKAKVSYFSKDTATHTIPTYFRTWLMTLLAERAKANYGGGPVPVYLISTEGGGIRSAYWTATALQQLDRAQPGFFRHVFAISGVSGGSVGATVFTAQYRDRLLAEQRNDGTQFRFNLDQFFKRDYLSPLLTAMLIPDMLQKFSPVAINGVDRAQYLEDGWANAYADSEVQVNVPASSSLPARATHTLDSSFVSLWTDPATRYRIPVLFLNATQAETGRKGIMTPLVIQRDPHFSNVVDIQEEVYRHIPLKTAASISARFPLVTPPATIRVVNEPAVDASNFVDGGYLDNSGTTTLLSILSSINSDQKLVDTLNRYNVVFRIISMNNSVETNPNQPIKSINGLYEFKAPLLAFFGSWDNSGDYRRYAVKEYARGFSNYGRTSDSAKTNRRLISQQLYSINLNRRVGVIPLGWDLSEQAEFRIQEQGRQLFETCRQANRYQDLLADLAPRPKVPTPIGPPRLNGAVATVASSNAH